MYVYIVYYSIVVYIYISSQPTINTFGLSVHQKHTQSSQNRNCSSNNAQKLSFFLCCVFLQNAPVKHHWMGPQWWTRRCHWDSWDEAPAGQNSSRFVSCGDVILDLELHPISWKKQENAVPFFLTLEYLIDHDEWWFLWLVKYMDNEKASYLFKATHPRSQRIQTPQRVDHLSWRAPIPALSGSSSIQIWSTTSVGVCFVGVKNGRRRSKCN